MVGQKPGIPTVELSSWLISRGPYTRALSLSHLALLVSQCLLFPVAWSAWKRGRDADSPVTHSHPCPCSPRGPWEGSWEWPRMLMSLRSSSNQNHFCWYSQALREWSVNPSFSWVFKGFLQPSKLKEFKGWWFLFNFSLRGSLGSSPTRPALHSGGKKWVSARVPRPCSQHPTFTGFS